MNMFTALADPSPASSGLEMAISPPLKHRSANKATMNSDAIFRSPRPTKTSNICVVTRIRPLLEDEIARGRQASVIPINHSPTTNSIVSPTSSSDNNDGDENVISPRPSMVANFRPSRLNSPSFQSENILPKRQSHISTPSSLPPAKSSSRKTPSTSPSSSYRPATSLYAATGPQSKKQFDFDAVLGMDSTQQQVYTTAVGDKIMSNIFRGINLTIMAYGQTSSGKSHTMQGYNDEVSPKDDGSENRCPNSPTSVFNISENDGIIPRAIHDIFKGKLDYKSSGKGTVSIDLTYFEIYNEDIRDLLVDDDDFSPLKMLDQGDSGVLIEGLTTIPIHSAKQVQNLINYAAQKRATACTNANAQSSRSHSICTLTVSITPLNKSSGSEFTQAKLTLVDLAGSERIKKTGVEGRGKIESITINKDLFVLGKVVAALADKSRSSGKAKHVPFRDSKLTRLLRESLGGNCFTIMISCVAPADSDIEESINTLRYAERARSISNSIKRNVARTLLTPDECAALTAENLRLKSLVTKLKNQVASDAGSLLDHDEEDSRPSLSVPPSEIFRTNSKSSYSEVGSIQTLQEEEKPSDKPLWRHFKDLAALTKNVTISTESMHEPTREIELKERRREVAPERCLSYEMSLLPSGTDDLLVGDEDRVNVPTSNRLPNDKQAPHLWEECNALRDEVNQLKREQQEVVRDIKSKRQELESLSKQYADNKASMERSVEQKSRELTLVSSDLECKAGELEETQSVLSQLRDQIKIDEANHKELQKEATQLAAFIEEVTKNVNLLDISSPQKNFSSILKHLDGSNTSSELVEMTVSEEEEAQSSDQEGNDLDKELEGSFGALQLTFRNLESSLKTQVTSVNDEASCNSVGDDVAALEQQLAYEQRQRRLSDRNKVLSDSQVGVLQERIGELEGFVKGLHTSLAEEKKAVTSTIARYESQLEGERERCRCLVERLNFMEADYECMVSTLQQTLSDLQDEYAQEKHLRSDFEYQIKCLRSSITELESNLEAKCLLVENASSTKAELGIQMDAMQQKITGLEELLRVEKGKVEALESQKGSKPPPGWKTITILTEVASPKTQDSPTASPTSDPNSCDSPTSPESVLSQKPSYIRQQAVKMLKLADEAIGRSANDGRSITSGNSSAGTDFRPLAVAPSALRGAGAIVPVGTSQNGTKPPRPTTRPAESNAEQVVSNIAEIVKDETKCLCGSKLFAEKKEYVEFYLPQISVECTCGRIPKNSCDDFEDPCALGGILRPWQVEFLKHVGIEDAVSLVYEHTQRGGVLATELRRWRKAQGLPSVRTKSCAVALQIWARTCKKVVRSVRSQRAQGIRVPRRPEFLELNLADDDKSAVSSLGGGPFRNRRSSKNGVV